MNLQITSQGRVHLFYLRTLPAGSLIGQIEFSELCPRVT